MKDYKDINGKLPLQLIDPIWMEGLGKVLHYGIQKYGIENEGSWKHSDEQQYIGALYRHMLEHQKGNLIDPESGLPHIEHAMFNIYAVAWHYYYGNTNKE